MTRAREAARLIGNNTFRLDSNNAVGFNSTTPDAMFDINHGLTVAGVSTFSGNVTMSGDLTVQGTTTTLDTNLQEVDLINVQANASVPAIGVTQSGSGNIISAYDGTSEVFSVADGGNVGVADKIIHLGDTDTAVRFPAANTFTVETAGSEAIRVDSSQRLLVNTATTRNNYDNGSVSSNLLHVERTAASGNAGISICANAATAADAGAILYMGRTKATSNGNTDVVADDDLIARISFQGADGSQLVEAASIKVDVDGTPGANDMPGRIEFHTTSDGSAGATERLRIDSSGRVMIATTTEGSTSADNLTIADSGHCGVTIRSGTTSSGSVYFSDATSGSGEYEGYIQYNHLLRQLNLGSRAATRLIITEDGADFDTTGSVKVPVGTTAERPTGVAGDFRYNSTLGQFEGYTTEWGEIGGGGGITTTASAPSANTIVYLDLGSAQYHELALSAGITTISCSNGNVGESHIVVINQPSAGIATVGFDTYFEFPSGAAPVMSEGGSAVDMVSFVVKKAAGAGGTELLASAGLNYQ